MGETRSVGATPFDSGEDATVPVPDLDAGLALHRDALGNRLLWRDDDVGQAGHKLSGSATELALTTCQEYEPNLNAHAARVPRRCWEHLGAAWFPSQLTSRWAMSPLSRMRSATGASCSTF